MDEKLQELREKIGEQKEKDPDSITTGFSLKKLLAKIFKKDLA